MKMKLAVVAGLAMVLSAPVFATPVCELPWNWNLPRCLKNQGHPIDRIGGFEQIKFTLCMGVFPNQGVPIVELTAAGLRREFIRLSQDYCADYEFPGRGTVTIQFGGMGGNESYIGPGETMTICKKKGGGYAAFPGRGC